MMIYLETLLYYIRNVLLFPTHLMCTRHLISESLSTYSWFQPGCVKFILLCKYSCIPLNNMWLFWVKSSWKTVNKSGLDTKGENQRTILHKAMNTNSCTSHTVMKWYLLRFVWMCSFVFKKMYVVLCSFQDAEIPEAKLQSCLRHLLTLTHLWEPHPKILASLWDHFYKKLVRTLSLSVALNKNRIVACREIVSKGYGKG